MCCLRRGRFSTLWYFDIESKLYLSLFSMFGWIVINYPSEIYGWLTYTQPSHMAGYTWECRAFMYHMAWDMSGSRKDVCSAIVLVCDTSVCLTIRIFQFHIDERMCRSVWQRNCDGFKWLHLSRMLAGLVVFQCFLSIFSFFFGFALILMLISFWRHTFDAHHRSAEKANGDCIYLL